MEQAGFEYLTVGRRSTTRGRKRLRPTYCHNTLRVLLASYLYLSTPPAIPPSYPPAVCTITSFNQPRLTFARLLHHSSLAARRSPCSHHRSSPALPQATLAKPDDAPCPALSPAPSTSVSFCRHSPTRRHSRSQPRPPRRLAFSPFYPHCRQSPISPASACSSCALYDANTINTSAWATLAAGPTTALPCISETRIDVSCWTGIPNLRRSLSCHANQPSPSPVSISSLIVTNPRKRSSVHVAPNAFPATRVVVSRPQGEYTPIEYVQVGLLSNCFASTIALSLTLRLSPAGPRVELQQLAAKTQRR